MCVGYDYVDVSDLFMWTMTRELMSGTGLWLGQMDDLLLIVLLC